MDIQHLKSRLDIMEIAGNLGISIGRYNKALCPFHAEGAASLQFMEKAGSVRFFCFTKYLEN